LITIFIHVSFDTDYDSFAISALQITRSTQGPGSTLNCFLQVKSVSKVFNGFFNNLYLFSIVMTIIIYGIVPFDECDELQCPTSTSSNLRWTAVSHCACLPSALPQALLSDLLQLNDRRSTSV
jgi:hypothetical protein